MRPPSKKPDKILRTAHAALAKGNFKNAIATLGRAIAKTPGNPYYHDLMAGALFFQGRHEDALPYATKASELGPDTAAFLRGEGTILAALNRGEEAIVRLGRAIEIAPQDIEARTALGATLAKFGRPREAEAHLREALRAAPDAADARYYLGMALCFQNKLPEAEEQFRGVLDLVPGHTDTLFELGRLLYELDNAKGAAAALGKVLKERPDSVDTLTLLGRICARRSEFETGEEMLRRAARLSPSDPKILEDLAYLYLDWQKPREALQALTDAYEISPTSVGVLSSLSFFSAEEVGFAPGPAIDQARQTLQAEDQTSHLILNFAKARALDKTKEYKDAWHEAVTANSTYHATHQLETSAITVFVEEAAAGSEALIGQPPAALPPAADRPLFIVIGGMPRSGKSTAEELIGQVPGVKLGYETNILVEAVQDLNEKIGIKLIERLKDLPVGYYSQFGEVLNDKLAERGGDSSAYTITLPMTYLMNNISKILGTIPNSVILFLDRDGFDNALRIFFYWYQFAGHDYTYRLSSIIRQIEAWRSAIAWWSKAAPARCLSIGYEDMIADPAATLSKICAFCGLPGAKLPLAPLPDDRGCAAPYRQMMEVELNDGE